MAKYDLLHKSLTFWKSKALKSIEKDINFKFLNLIHKFVKCSIILKLDTLLNSILQTNNKNLIFYAIAKHHFTQQNFYISNENNMNSNSNLQSFYIYIIKLFLDQNIERFYNLIDSENVNANVIKKEIIERFQQNKIYTFLGPFLIAVNPFQYLPIYTSRYMRRYCYNSKISSPHIFSVASKVYEKILHFEKNQCIIINGVSGSGKTESAKFLIEQFLYMSKTLKHDYIQSINNAAIQILEVF